MAFGAGYLFQNLKGIKWDKESDLILPILNHSVTQLWEKVINYPLSLEYDLASRAGSDKQTEQPHATKGGK